MSNNDLVNCDQCGRELSKNSGAYTMSMFADHPLIDEFKQTFGKTELNACMICFAKALGFRPIKPLPSDLTGVRFEDS